MFSADPAPRNQAVYRNFGGFPFPVSGCLPLLNGTDETRASI